jgi:uncharacterized protein
VRRDLESGDARAGKVQSALITIAKEPVTSALNEARRLLMPLHHDVRAKDVDLKRLGAVLAVAHEQDLRDFASLLLVEGLGPRTLQSLALIAEVVHGAPARFSDPARFSFAHGGKDGHPFPVPLETYDESLAVLRRSLEAARLGHTEKLEGFRRLDGLTREVEEGREPLADFRAAIRHEYAISPSIGGRTVFDDKTPTKTSVPTQQLSLFWSQSDSGLVRRIEPLPHQTAHVRVLKKTKLPDIVTDPMLSAQEAGLAVCLPMHNLE